LGSSALVAETAPGRPKPFLQASTGPKYRGRRAAPTETLGRRSRRRSSTRGEREQRQAARRNRARAAAAAPQPGSTRTGRGRCGHPRPAACAVARFHETPSARDPRRIPPRASAMTAYIVRRIWQMIPTMLRVVLLVFILFNWV